MGRIRGSPLGRRVQVFAAFLGYKRPWAPARTSWRLKIFVLATVCEREDGSSESSKKNRVSKVPGVGEGARRGAL